MSDLKPIKTLRPFTKFLMTIGELPSSYLLSMAYEEQLLWFCNYLQKTVIPTINNNSEAVEELQKLYVELENYVNDYFENLDVQEEINNKLDEMVEDGTLDRILNNYIQVTKVYNTLQDLINDEENLVNNMKVKTLGYYTINDVGGADYYITDTPTANYQITIGNLYAVLISPDKINIKKLGAKGDGVNDDTQAINNAITYWNDIYIPNGSYLISSGFTLKNNLKIVGENNVTIKQKDNSNITNIFTGSTKNHIVLKNLNIDLNVTNQEYTDRANQGRGILLTSSSYIKIENVNTNKIYGSFIYMTDSNNINIDKCEINDPDGAYSSFGIYLVRIQHGIINRCNFNGVRNYGTSLSSYGVQAKDSCLDIVVQNCYFYQMQCIIDGSKTNGTSTTATSCKIINNLLVNTPGDTTMRYCKYGLIANNITRGSGDFGISVGDSEMINVCNNIVEGSNTVGIGIRKSSQCTVNNNSIYDPCVNFRNLSLVANQRDGIYVLGNSRRTNVCNNTIIDIKSGNAKMYSGIRIEDVSDGVSGADGSFGIIANNTIYGASQLASQIVAENTTNVIGDNLLQS